LALEHFAQMAAEGVAEAVPSELPLIEAKLAQPRIRAGVIPRARLFIALDRLDQVELTMISGPAGAGKTVLVSFWLAGRSDHSPAWVTLDRGDDDPRRLWTYVVHAVDRVRPGLASRAIARLRMPRSSVEAGIDELLNALAGYDGSVVIVLDDLQHVSSERCLRSLAYAVERLPGATRMVAMTRSDPGRRLGRLRARGALGELRAHEIAFNSEEARELLVERVGIAVSVEDVELLVERTEGWPAGVSLAALWLAGLKQPSVGIRQFSADHRHVADYLTSEVLDALEGDTRSFLLRTSILDRFTARLCDAVLGTESAAAVLAEIERSNLFLVALDARGVWYRYTTCFASCCGSSLPAPVQRPFRSFTGAPRSGCSPTACSRRPSRTLPPPAMTSSRSCSRPSTSRFSAPASSTPSWPFSTSFPTERSSAPRCSQPPERSRPGF